MRTALLTLLLILGAGGLQPPVLAVDGGRDPQRDGAMTIYPLAHGGRERTYGLYLPKGYDPGRPHALLLALHGGTGSARKWPPYTDNGFERLADQDQFLLVYPEGVDGQWNDRRGVQDFVAHRENVDDLGFLAALLDSLVARYPVDQDRIYVAGASNGGMMAHYVGSELGDRVAAMAAVIAAIPERLLPLLQPKAPLPVLMINGSDDPLVRWQGGVVRFAGRETGTVIPVEETVRFWLQHNGISQPPLVTELPDRDPADGTRVVQHLYSGGRDKSEVVLYQVQGGGHTWPAFHDPRGLLMRLVVDEMVGTKSRDIDACQLIWAFFKAHPKARPSRGDGSGQASSP
ncbi:MAG: PHB depolymerase family esterase [Thermodesulfobacteriota bacterium]